MTEKQIKMVALDLDGTTLNDEKIISDRTVAAFKKAMERGVHIVIATGRTYSSLPEQIFTIAGLEYLVTSNGAHITRIADRKLIYEDYIPAGGVERVAELMRDSGIPLEVFVKGKAYIDKEEYEDIMARGSSYRDVEYIRKTRNPVPKLIDFMLEHKHSVENINVEFEFLEDKERWRKPLANIDGTTLTSSFAHNFEIGGRNTSKAAALSYLMELLSLTPDQLMACGDSPNDEEMIKLAGLGVAMANASEQTKKTADCITDSNNRDGVAKAIERFVLKEC